MNTKKKRNYILIVLIVLLLALAIGYAAFNSTLTISGTAKGNGTWDIHFKSAGRFLKADGTTVDDTHGGTATLKKTSTDNDTMEVSVNLGYPGDGVLLEVVVENSGTIPAKLTGFSITGADTDLVIEKAAAGPTENETLAANGGTCTAKFLVKWSESSTASSLGTKSFTITYDYAQDTTAFTATPTHTH